MTSTGDHHDSGTASATALSAVEARALIAEGSLSPVELTEACITRVEELNPHVNAFTATCFRRARAEAAVAESAVRDGQSLPPLHGLPFGVKDLEDTAGLLTTRGTPSLRDHVPTTDAASVARLRQAGAIVLGKTNVPEEGAGANSRNPVWGATGNPFDPRLNAGGSSGGSAAALACEMVPLATGSDTGGSLRIPASICGVVGFRPSPGMVASERRPLGWAPLSVAGPMARTVADTRLMLAAMIGTDDRDPLSFPISLADDHQPEINASDLRIGYLEDLGHYPVEQGIRETFRARIAALEPKVASCERIDLTWPVDPDRCFDVLRAVGMLTKHNATYETDPDLLGPQIRANLEIARQFGAADIAWAEAGQTTIFRHFTELLSDYDLIISPVTPVTPFPWTTVYAEEVDGVAMANYYRWFGLTYAITLTGLPSMSLPSGVDQQGMPFGLQLVAGHRRDGFLLDAAEVLETVLGADPVLRRPVPDVQRLAGIGADLPSADRPRVDLRSIVTAPPPVELTRDHL